LSEDEDEHGSSSNNNNNNRERGGGGKIYRRRIDASLVDALYLMVNANCQKDVLDAEKRIRALIKTPSEFPTEVNERVIKATAMAGLVSLSSTLLKTLLRDKGLEALPSEMAYTAVLNVLRKNGRIDRLEEALMDLASARRRMAHATGRRRKDGGGGGGIDLIAFNTYLAALCDAAVKEVPFSSASSIIEEEFGGTNDFFNFTVSTNISSVTTTTTAAATSSSEKYLYKALNLLRGDVARTKFMLAGDPDRYSYNSILSAAAKCSKKFDTVPVMVSCLRGMKERGLSKDVLTYNARIQAALASSPNSQQGEEAAIRLIDQLLADRDVEPDRYSINFLLKPFIRAGRRDEIWSILQDFYGKNVDGGGGGSNTANNNNNRMVSSAFEAFLNTIVQAGEVEFAHEVFETFFLLWLPRQTQRSMPQSQKIIKAEQILMQQNNDGVGNIDFGSMLPSMSPGRSIDMSRRPSPRTRHFNILFSGYSKAYLSAAARYGKNHQNNTEMKSENFVSETPEDDANTTILSDNATTRTIDTTKVYELLDTMLRIGVPLDGYSVSSLMALPSTPGEVTSLLKRIEPEMMVELNPAAYRSIISAYGKVGDPSSASWMFDEMIQSTRGNQGQNRENWNTLLGALAKGCVVGTNKSDERDLDILNSSAAQTRKLLQIETNGGNPQYQIIDHVNGKSCLDASLAILNLMRNQTEITGKYKIPKPNSQSYCLVASSLSGYGTSEAESDRALNLFRNAMDEGVAADGRFLNAVIRCFGDDIEGVLAAWKSDIGPAAAAYERISSRNTKSGTNLIAAYNGLMHVCGRALRPDVATRIAYAMNKANVEPAEATLRSYYAGKRVALGGNDDDDAKNLGFRKQYETLLTVECTKYNAKDKRQAKDRKIRIIL